MNRGTATKRAHRPRMRIGDVAARAGVNTQTLRYYGRLHTRRDLSEAIVDGAARRVRPKLMTVLTMMIGLVPVLWSTGTGADVMKRIAAPMVGGLVTSFVLELLVYPAIFAIWKGRRLPSGDGAVAVLKPKQEAT
jgi:Cu/Ag efflux pump CusA